MEYRLRIRMYPNKMQRELIHKTFGCVRYVYNYYLAKKRKLYEEEGKNLRFNDMCKDLTFLKSENPWLKEPDKCALQNALKDLNQAYERFFNGQNRFPKFKKKKNHYMSYRTNFTYGNIEIVDNKIKLPKLGRIKIREKKAVKGRIINVAVIFTPSGKYYASVLFSDVSFDTFPKANKSVGLDLGISNLITTSDGETFANLKLLANAERRLQMIQRNLSRKTIGSSNWNKNRIKLAKMHEKIANTRIDYLQKLSTQLVRENDLICLEDLNIKGMLKNHHMAQAVFDVSWYEFRHMLEYKSLRYGRKVQAVDAFYPSSQLCNVCGYKNEAVKKLYVRTWECPICGTKHDRDINAAKNILNKGIELQFIA